LIHERGLQVAITHDLAADITLREPSFLTLSQAAIVAFSAIGHRAISGIMS
jgi:hypothetical protein